MPRILFLTPSCPLPQVSGDRIRAYNLIRQLAARGWQVSLFSLFRGGTAPTASQRRQLEDLCECVVLEANGSQVTRTARLLANLVRRRAFHRDYFSVGRARGYLEKLLTSGSFDVVLVSQLYTYGWVPNDLHRICVLDSHNVEERRLEALARSERVSARALAARIQLRPVAAFEGEAVTRVRRTLAVSRQEFEHFERLAPGRVRLVPNGVNTSELHARDTLPREPRILFVGSLNYSANIDAVRHLARAILPHVRRRDLSVTVVGVNPPRAVYAASRRSPVRMDVLGYVDDIRPHVEASRLLVVPLRYGGGTRLKILEALAQGLPVISTSLGCEGLELTHGEEVVVADDAVEFARWIERLCDDDDLCARLSVRGRKKVESSYDWSRIGTALHSALVEICDAEGGSRAMSLPITPA